MKAHAVPQEIMSMEFKLFGNFLSLREFLFIAGGVATAYFFYFLSRQGLIPGILAWPAVLLFGLGGVMMGLVPIQDRPLDAWIINYFQAIRRPTQRVWKKPGFNPVNTDIPGNSETASTVSVKDHVVAPPQSAKKNVVGTSDTPVEAAAKSALNENDQKRIDDEELERLREIERSLQDAADKQKEQQIKVETTDSNTTRQEATKAAKGKNSNSQSASNSQKKQPNKSQNETASKDNLQKMPSYDINKDMKSREESNSKKNSKSKMDNQTVKPNNQNQSNNPPNQQTPPDQQVPSYDIQSRQNRASQQTAKQDQNSGQAGAPNQNQQPQQPPAKGQQTPNPATPPGNEADNTTESSASRPSTPGNPLQTIRQQDQPARAKQDEDQEQFRAPGPSADINAANTSFTQQQPSGSAPQQPVQQAQQPTQQPVPQSQQPAQNDQDQANSSSGFITISDDNVDQFKTAIPGVEPNVNNINIVTKDREGQYIPKVTCIVKDQLENPVRAALSNQLGQIVNNVPLKDGSYKVQLSKQGYVFPLVTRVLTGKKYPAIEIRSL
jgi:hypothetical protein